MSQRRQQGRVDTAGQESGAQLALQGTLWKVDVQATSAPHCRAASSKARAPATQDRGEGEPESTWGGPGPGKAPLGKDTMDTGLRKVRSLAG